MADLAANESAFKLLTGTTLTSGNVTYLQDEILLGTADTPEFAGLGIGTTTPLTNVEIVEDNAPAILTIKGGLNSQTTAGNEIASLDFRSNDPSILSTNDISGRIVSVAEIANGSAAGLAFYTAYLSPSPYLEERMRIDRTGNVGIGTTTPGVELHAVRGAGTVPPLGSQVGLFQNNSVVTDNCIVGVVAGLTGLSGIQFGTDTSISRGSVTYSHSSNSLSLATSGSEKIRIESSGNVGIGTTTPAATLDVVGTIKTSGYTVATLPTAATGMKTYVTDANATTFMSTVAGGGANTVPLFYDGANWKIA
tara:strand:- start:27071 stop:27994 length:924 start_codon:yes stop_codon:yes gene_type:complete